ncbi:MAG: hypothetical protein AABW72_01480 [archaeon]
MVKPVVKYSIGVINVAVWENEGKEGTKFNTVTINRRYKDKDETWKSSNSLRVNDIPKAIMVLNKAYETLAVKQHLGTEFEQTEENNV